MPALTRCVCGRVVAAKEDNCPYCGSPMPLPPQIAHENAANSLPPGEGQSPDLPATNEATKAALIAFVVIGGLVLGLAMYFLGGGKSQDDNYRNCHRLDDGGYGQPATDLCEDSDGNVVQR